MRLTFICPAALVDDANDLAMVLAYGPADGLTYRVPAWRDTDGNFYSVASSQVGPSFLGNATSTLERPAWDVEPYVVNMAGANRAQTLVSMWNGQGAVPQANTSALVVLPGDEPLALLAAAGLSRVTT